MYTGCSTSALVFYPSFSISHPLTIIPSIYLLLEFFLSLCLFIIHDGYERTLGVKMVLPVCLGCLYWLATGFYIVLLPPDTVTIPLVLFVGKKQVGKETEGKKLLRTDTELWRAISDASEFRYRTTSAFG